MPKPGSPILGDDGGLATQKTTAQSHQHNFSGLDPRDEAREGIESKST